jgi:hypothetical protein
LTVGSIIGALQLPAVATAGQRTVPKKELIEAGGLKGKDAKLVRESIEKLRWIAVLKPDTVGIEGFSDDEREVSEISVLTLEVRKQKALPRLEELIHAAIPYHLLLLSEGDGACSLSTARKRRSKAEKEAFVVDGGVVRMGFTGCETGDATEAFLTSLDLSTARHASLASLYSDWIDAIVSLRASRITGAFESSASPEQAVAREKALRSHTALTEEAAQLRKRTEKATQARDRVQLNTELQAVRKSLDKAVRILAQEETQDQ